MAESTAKNYTAYVTKAPTPLHEFYAGWIAEKTGFEPDLKAVQIAVNLYGDFQKSPEWIAERDRLRAEAEAAKLAVKAGKKPGTTKAEREAKKIADALEALKAAGIDTSGLAVKIPVASATELPGNPVVEAGAVVDIPADPEPVIGTNDTIEDDAALVAELEANPAPNPDVKSTYVSDVEVAHDEALAVAEVLSETPISQKVLPSAPKPRNARKSAERGVRAAKVQA